VLLASARSPAQHRREVLTHQGTGSPRLPAPGLQEAALTFGRAQGSPRRPALRAWLPQQPQTPLGSCKAPSFLGGREAQSIPSSPVQRWVRGARVSAASRLSGCARQPCCSPPPRLAMSGSPTMDGSAPRHDGGRGGIRGSPPVGMGCRGTRRIARCEAGGEPGGMRGSAEPSRASLQNSKPDTQQTVPPGIQPSRDPPSAPGSGGSAHRSPGNPSPARGPAPLPAGSRLPQEGTPGLEKFVPGLLHGFAPAAPGCRERLLAGKGCSPLAQLAREGSRTPAPAPNHLQAPPVAPRLALPERRWGPTDTHPDLVAGSGGSSLQPPLPR